MEEALWIQMFKGTLENLLSSEELNMMLRILTGEDNMGCISDAKTPRVSDLSKHVDIKYRFGIDQITKAVVDTHYIPSNQMIEHLLSKS